MAGRAARARDSDSSDGTGVEYQDSNLRSMYAVYRPRSLPERKKLSSLGRPIDVEVNAFQARAVKLLAGQLDIYRYDIKYEQVNPGEKPLPRPVQERVWASRTVQENLKGSSWLYDGNNLAWSTANKPDTQFVVDMNLMEGRGASRPDSKQLIRVYITRTNNPKVDFGQLAALLSNKTNVGKPGEAPAGWQQAITVLDNLIHQGPKGNHLVIKKSFFKKAQRVEELGNGIKVMRGVFGSIKVALQGWQNNLPIRSLCINMDATTACFWSHGSLLSVILTSLGMNNADQFSTQFRNVAKSNPNGWPSTRLGQELQRLKGLRVIHLHREAGKKPGEKSKEFSIRGFKNLPPSAFYFIVEEKENKKPGDLPPGKYSITEYFMKRYGKGKESFMIFPCVEMSDKSVVPIEVCEVLPDQRYNMKLNPRQTTNMLKIAAQPPKSRLDHIKNGFAGLNWQNDKWMKDFNVEVKPLMSKVNARQLDVPDIMFGRGMVAASKAQQGKWRIQGLPFIESNRKVIKSWACCAVNDGRGACVTQPQTKKFAQELMNIFTAHGGKFQGRPVPAFPPPLDIRDLGNNIRHVIDILKNKGGVPDLLIVVVPDKSSDTYNQIKKVSDCLFGIASQVLQSSHVQKCSPEYISNVCMKINAKLGGATCAIKPHPRVLANSPFYDPKEKILIVGADVTHGAPGSHAPSVASLVMSQNSKYTRYSGMVETNGQRMDIIQPFQMDKLFTCQLNNWMTQNGGKPPTRVMYFRDGVSREQCRQVIEEEVRDMKNVFIKLMEDQNDGVAKAKAIKFTAIVCTKRHHVRIFPRNGDKNGNPVPGTLVETGVTDGVALDWYLNSHVALKGTARPMHYMVIVDESDFNMEQLQQFIFEHSFQYARSTTPVSQHPAIYYAHLCSRRGACHEEKALTTSSQKMIDQLQLEGMTVNQAVEAVQGQKRREAAKKAKEGAETMMLPVWGELAHSMWYI